MSKISSIIVGFFWYCKACGYEWSGSSSTTQCPRCGAKL